MDAIALGIVSVCLVPAGHSMSTRSTLEAVPSPMTTASWFCEQYPVALLTIRLSVRPPAVTRIHAPMPSGLASIAAEAEIRSSGSHFRHRCGKSLSRPSAGGDDEIEIAVAVDIAERGAARDDRLR